MKAELIVKWACQAATEAVERAKKSLQEPATETELQIFAFAFRQGYLQCHRDLRLHNQLREKP